MAPEDTTDHTAHPWFHCEFGKTLFSEGECQRPGVDQLNGSLLCVPHAKRLRLEVREDMLLGTVFEMDKWLDNPNNRADQLHWQRVLGQRDEVLEQLRFNRTLLEAHKEAIQQR
jgi:hypothetical protein